MSTHTRIPRSGFSTGIWSDSFINLLFHFDSKALNNIKIAQVSLSVFKNKKLIIDLILILYFDV